MLSFQGKSVDGKISEIVITNIGSDHGERALKVKRFNLVLLGSSPIESVINAWGLLTLVLFTHYR